jgi:lysophospholipase L1-like esterase
MASNKKKRGNPKAATTKGKQALKQSKARPKPAPRLSSLALKWCEHGRSTADTVFKRQKAKLERQAAEVALRAESIAAVDGAGRPLYREPLVVQAAAGFLVAQGDSWFSYGSGDTDIPGVLMANGYDVNRDEAHAGVRIYDMATVGLPAFLTVISRALAAGQIPKAILVSGGGNDVGNRKTMPDVLLPAPNGVNMPALRKIIDELIQNAYVAILDGVTRTCLQYLPKPIPILVHGYDYPIPDGRPTLFAWLKPAFVFHRYPRDPLTNKPHMITIINTFNEMLLRLPTLVDDQGKRRFEHVVHVEVRGVLTAANYKDDWDNELHPTEAGFRNVAQKFLNTLNAL